MVATPAAAGAAGEIPSRGTLLRASNLLLLLLLGFVFIFIYGAVRDEEETTITTTTTTTTTTATASAVKPHGFSNRGGNIGPIADDYRRVFSRGKHDEISALTPSSVRRPGEETLPDSPAMTAHRRRKELEVTQDIIIGRHPVETDGSGGDDSQAVMIRRRGEESLGITKATLKKLGRVIVVQHEGIVYCPIPKTACSEWRRTLRWMAGVDNWEEGNGVLHLIVQNGLERLIDRGLKETRWAFTSNRLLRFVVVREPAERLVSAFLNKCVVHDYERRNLERRGAKNCLYLDIIPELFPNTTKASPASHARLKELADSDPEDTFYHFVSGIWREAEAHGDTCQIANLHFRPQACFCDLPNLLPAFHVIPFSNLSAEAEAFAGRLPAALPDSPEDVKLDVTGVAGTKGKTASNRKTGVDEARREEIHEFLRQRFVEFHKDATEGITHAAERKHEFLSERVMEIIDKMYGKDYHLLGEYFYDLE